MRLSGGDVREKLTRAVNRGKGWKTPGHKTLLSHKWFYTMDVTQTIWMARDAAFKLRHTSPGATCGTYSKHVAGQALEYGNRHRLGVLPFGWWSADMINGHPTHMTNWTIVNDGSVYVMDMMFAKVSTNQPVNEWLFRVGANDGPFYNSEC